MNGLRRADLPERASVVVIGGGVIGTSIACHLAAAGVPDVVLLERDELASGSTCKAAGGIRTSFSTAANIAIGLRGLDVYSRFARDHGQEIDFSRNGYLFTLSDERTLATFTEAVALQNHHGIEARIISPDEAQRLSPLLSTEGMIAGAWAPDDAKATPEAVVQGYAATSRRAGARIVRHCAVTDIESSGGVITGVVTDRGRIATDTVVCAAGAWSRQIGRMVGVDIPVTPVRRQVAFTEPLDCLPAHSPSLTLDFPSTLYFHPEGDRLLIGWSDPDQEPGFNLKFELDQWLEGVGEIAAVRVPAILDYGISTGWAGLYEVTPDHNQIIDRAAAVPGLIIAAGYSGHGFLMGPATGEIVRDMYLGIEPGYDITDFALDRFSGAHVTESHIV